MKRIIYLFAIVLGIQQVAAQQVQKIKVLDSLTIKTYVYSTAQKIDDFNTKTAQYIESETMQFNYNKKGNLIYFKHKKKDGQLWADIQRDKKETIVSVARNTDDENKAEISLTYKENLLQLLTENDLFYNDPLLNNNTYEYDKSNLPYKLTQISTYEGSTSYVYQLKYTNNQIKTIEANSVVTTYTYDTKKYPFSSQPNYWDITISDPLTNLTFTNYVQKNNLIKVENKYRISTYIHTYNSSNLPIKTIAIEYYTKDGKYWPFFKEYTYHYKEITITE